MVIRIVGWADKIEEIIQHIVEDRLLRDAGQHFPAVHRIPASLEYLGMQRPSLTASHTALKDVDAPVKLKRAVRKLFQARAKIKYRHRALPSSAWPRIESEIRRAIRLADRLSDALPLFLRNQAAHQSPRAKVSMLPSAAALRAICYALRAQN